jgi:hypothetical protein
VRHDDNQEEYANSFHQDFFDELKDSKDKKSVIKCKGLHYKKATLSSGGCKFHGERATTIVHTRDLQRFSGKQVVSRNRPADAEDYISPPRNRQGLGCLQHPQEKNRVLT